MLSLKKSFGLDLPESFISRVATTEIAQYYQTKQSVN